MAADELVRVRIGNIEKNMGRALAESSDGVEILEGEPVKRGDGSFRDDSGADGRPLKPRTSVDEEAARKATSRSASSKNDKE